LGGFFSFVVSAACALQKENAHKTSINLIIIVFIGFLAFRLSFYLFEKTYLLSAMRLDMAV
jgi:hypothetical protein